MIETLHPSSDLQLLSLFYILGGELIDVIKQREIDYFKLSESMSDSMSNLMNIYLNNKLIGKQYCVPS